MYGLGAPVHLTTSFYNGATPPVLVDPATVSVYITLPDGTSTGALAAVKDSTGLYHYDYTPLETGIYQWYFSGTGTNIGIQLPDIFTVAPVTTAGLISLGDAKAILNKQATYTGDDNELWGWIQAATHIINTECGYTVATTFTETTSSLTDSGGRQVLMVSKTPVLSVTSITPTQQNIPVIDITTLVINKPDGIIYLANWFSWYGPQVIVYAAGRTSVPATLQEACGLIVQYFWETQRGGAVSNAVSGFGGGDMTASYGGMPGFPTRALDLMRMGDHYAAPGLA